MSVFHQIWDRPGDAAVELGRTELDKAEAPPAKTARERGYIAALAVFFKPEKRDYQSLGRSTPAPSPPAPGG